MTTSLFMMYCTFSVYNIQMWFFFSILKLQLDRSEWGSDLPSVEMHLESHKSVHRAIEEFQMSLKDAKLSEASNLKFLSFVLRTLHNIQPKYLSKPMLQLPALMPLLHRKLKETILFLRFR